MAQCRQTAQEFIQSTFSPQVAVLCSPDADHLSRKNNLSFVELIQPFSRLTSEAHIRDPNNVPHIIRNLKITLRDLNTQPPQYAVARKMLNDAVANAQPVDGGRGNVITVGIYDLQLSTTTPWYEAYRECFLQVMPYSDHEFLNHFYSCIFVVSSGHSDPISMLNALVNQQQQQQSNSPTKYPRWFCANTLNYYVLLHDIVEGELTKAEAVYQSMKAAYGANLCHLLQINSRSLHTAECLKVDANMPDPWCQFLSKPADQSELGDYDASASGTVEDSAFPSKVIEGRLDVNSLNLSGAVESASDVLEVTSDMNSSMNDVFDHPLAASTENVNNFSPNVEQLSPDGSVSVTSNSSISSSSSKQSSQSTEKTQSYGHGLRLTTSDHDRLRIFIHEFAHRALVPWAEKQMRILSDQLSSKKGLQRSIFSATRRWLSGSKPASQIAANQNTTVVYTTEAPELQMRRLADLAFLFQMYDFAYNTYHSVKRDFNNDRAWLHYAGALEMATIATFMQGNHSQRQYPHHYMESAITTYLQSCRNPHYATRATLISTEALKNRAMYAEAAMQYVKLSSDPQDSDLRSALVLEQAAHCFINKKTPLVRKYSFHMILAGHRFCKAGQRKHTLRAYTQALQIYKGKNWSLAEDHINFTLGRQSFNLKQLENATAAFKHLLTENSRQSMPQQNAFLREYLFVYKQLISQEVQDVGMYSVSLPELPLPMLDSNSTKILLGNRPNSPQGEKIPATGVWFDSCHKSNQMRWQKLEEILVKSANNFVLPSTFRPSQQCFTNNTDNRLNPVGFIGESIVVEVVLINPLKVTLLLTDVLLLWSFLPSLSTQEKAQVITNEMSSGVKNSLANEIIHNQVIDELLLQGNEEKAVQLLLTPQQTGDLRIVGIAYSLGSSSHNEMTVSYPGSYLDSNGPKPSYISSINVRGKQRLDVQGPRLNNTKEEKTSKIYGPDRRLDPIIHPEMPLLQVTFCNFPKTLLCGEVQPVTLQFTNVGSSPLHKLKIASTNPEFYTFGCHGDLPMFPCIYQTKTNAKENQTKSFVSVCQESVNVSRVLDISLSSGSLQPKSTVSVPAWIRGNDIGGVHEIDFTFYYEPVQENTKIRYRLLQHTATMNTIESLSVRAVCHPSSCHFSSSGSDQQSCVVACELENLSRVQMKKRHIKEIQVTQISGSSKDWAIKPLNTQGQSDVRICSRETIQMCMKAEMLKKQKSLGSISDQIIFSDVSFDSQQINSAKTPCADFYFHSQSEHKDLRSLTHAAQTTASQNSKTITEPLRSAMDIGLTLIILWKAYVSSEDGSVQIHVGQHHVNISRIGDIFASYPFVPILTEKPPVKFIPDETADGDVKSESEISTQLVEYTFQHRSDIVHSFTENRVCHVPVTLLLRNCSGVQVKVLIDTSNSQDRFNPDTESLVYPDYQEQPPLTSFCWVGRTNIDLEIDPDQQQQVHLFACFSAPGIYNINHLSVFVTYTTDSSQMILQKHLTPSVVIIHETS